MKWIGQHIYDFISKFRNDVYLEDINTGTIASGGNLGLDSNNKIVKANEASGGITAVSIITDTGGEGKAEDASGSADFSILGATGVGVTNSGTTITATAVPGEINHNALLNYDEGEHIDWSVNYLGADIAANNIPTLNQNTTGTAATVTGSTQENITSCANLTTVGTIGTGVWQGDAIDKTYINPDQRGITGVGVIGVGAWQATPITHAYIATDAIGTDNIADAQVTVAKLHADAIQTSGESFADNDTSLMTSAAIDDKINTKYSTSYITFSAKSTSSYGTNYVMIHASGISESTFSVNSSVDSAGDFGGVTTEQGGTGTDATATVVSSNLEQQIPIPETCKLIGFYATTTTTTNTGAAYDTGVAIWHVPESGVNWGSSADSTATLIHKSDSSRHAENTAHGGTNRKKVQMVKRMDGTAKDLAAGDILLPSIFGETADQQIMATITLVIATPIKTIA